jgi:kumamolisin
MALSLTGQMGLPALAGPGPVTIAQTPGQVASGAAQRIGAYGAQQHLRLAIGLTSRDLAGQEAFLRQVQDRTSPLFHRFMTPAEWNARFSPNASEEQAVVDWAGSAGLTVTKRYPNRLVVDLDGTVAKIQSALQVHIDTYRLGRKTFYSNDVDPTLPAALSGIVQSVNGLNDIQVLKAGGGLAQPDYPSYSPGAVVSAGTSGGKDGNGKRPKKRASESITNGSYDPTDIFSSEAYDANALYALGHCCNPTHNPNVTPPQTSIAVATAGTQLGSDFAGFHNQYPYLAYHYQQFNIDGSPPCCDGEGTMDFEWATAMSNSFGSLVDTSMVYMYNGANNSFATFLDIYNSILSNGSARIVSSSWGCAEIYCYDANTMNSYHNVFNAMAGQGYTNVQISHDKGAFADCAHRSVSFPGSDPNVVSAGGTRLNLTSGPHFVSHTAWVGGSASGSCSINDGGGGGGCSVQFAAPPYQTNSGSFCGNSRMEPDVSLNADWVNTPQNIYFNGGLSGNGGTSIVAPELAGFFASADAYLLSRGNICGVGNGTLPCAPMGNVNYAIYNAALGTAPGFPPHNPFYDITSGCTNNDVGTGYCGIAGYDRATGWGSINMLQMAWAINWWTMADNGGPSLSISGPSTGQWYNSDQLVNFSVADSGGGFPASGVSGYTARWDGDPGDPTSAATPGSGNSYYSGPATPNGTSGSLHLNAAGQGCHTAYVRGWDNMGLSAVTSYGSLCYDSVPPVITEAPAPSFKAGGVVGPTIPIVLKWNGSDTTSGIKNYSLWESVDGGTYQQIATPSGKQLTVDLAIAHNYQFAVGAFDNAGNFSGYSFSSQFGLHAYQEGSEKIVYSGGWTRQALSGAYGGQVEFATKANKTATFSFNGSQVAWVSTQGATRGSATVSLDGGTAKTVNTHKNSTKTAVIVSLRKTTQGAHTFVVNLLGTAGHPRVDVDAFLVINFIA